MPGYIINYYKYFTGPSEIKGSLFEYMAVRNNAYAAPKVQLDRG